MTFLRDQNIPSAIDLKTVKCGTGSYMLLGEPHPHSKLHLFFCKNEKYLLALQRWLNKVIDMELLNG